MHSVILTELGIIITSNDDNGEDKIIKSFPFSDATGQYLAVKNKEGAPNEMIRYLKEMQVGFLTNDESLLEILKKKDVDSQIMEESQIEQIQSVKPQWLIDGGFAVDQQDALSKLREFAVSLSSTKVTQVSESPDQHIIQAIKSLDEIDKIANAQSSRLREWYGLHFPELENLIDSINGYAQIVIAGKRENLTKQTFEDAGFPESKIQMLILIQEKSKGGDISEENLLIVQELAKQILEMHNVRKNLEEHLKKQMKAIAPNLAVILGDAVGARLLAKAGSLKKLAAMPASTIQVLGAEKALFRALKTGSQPPKHGLLFQHAMVHSAPRWQRGKIARAIAAKAAIAARVDIYGAGLNETLLEKLNVRIDEISKKYSEPVYKEDNRDKVEQQKQRMHRYNTDDDYYGGGGDNRRKHQKDRHTGYDDGPKKAKRYRDDAYSRGNYNDDDDDDDDDELQSRWPQQQRRRQQQQRRRPMFNAVCDQCGADCELPFRPNQNKPVYCDNCFNNDGKNSRRYKDDYYNDDDDARDRPRERGKKIRNNTTAAKNNRKKGKMRQRFGRKKSNSKRR